MDRTLYRAWYATVLLFGAAGVWWSWRDPAARPVAILILASAISVSVTQASFYVEGRHRLAIEPLLLVLAGVGLVGCGVVPFPLPPALRRLPRHIQRRGLTRSIQ